VNRQLTRDAAALTTPAFTAEDALAHVASHMMGSLVPPTVVGVQFMTDAKFLARFGPEPGLAPNKLLCVVEVQGRFRTMSGPSGATPSVYDVVYVVFNARDAGTTSCSMRQRPRWSRSPSREPVGGHHSRRAGSSATGRAVARRGHLARIP
jgi:hypothetical protein